VFLCRGFYIYAIYSGSAGRAHLRTDLRIEALAYEYRMDRSEAEVMQ
jgi:hypothetical protein